MTWHERDLFRYALPRSFVGNFRLDVVLGIEWIMMEMYRDFLRWICTTEKRNQESFPHFPITGIQRKGGTNAPKDIKADKTRFKFHVE